MILRVKTDHYAHVPHYKGELMEEVMQDYAKYPPMQGWDDALKYVFSTLAGKIFPWCKVTDDDAQKVYTIMYEYIKDNVHDKQELQIQLEGLDRLWPDLKQMMLGNRGLWKFMCDVGAQSLSFAIFPVRLTPRSIALESAFGVNYDNAGVYKPLLMVQDISMRSAAVEPEFVELRRRAYYARQCMLDRIPGLRDIKDIPSKEKLGTVVTLGAGLMPEFRKFGFTLAQVQSLNIVACDMDRNARKDLEMVMRYDFGVSLAETGIDYRNCMLQEVLNDRSLLGKVDVLLIDGVLSYCQSEQQLIDYLRGAKALLSKQNHGVIFCDLTVLDPTLMRCAIVQGWKTEDKAHAMHPDTSPKKAIAKMERACESVGGLHMRYEVDPRNPSPLGVIFWLS